MNKLALVLALAAALTACGKNNNGSTASTSPSTSTTSSSGSSTSPGSTTPSTSSTASTSSTPVTPSTPSTTDSASTSTSPSTSTAGSTSTPSTGTTVAAGSGTPGTSGTAGGSAGSTTMGASAGSGEAVFNQTCQVCHGAGVAGAPKVGDKADWGPRVAQGKDTLYQHAIGGFTGKKGVMPPKGGNTALADADVKAAVDYMVAKAK
jgi:cytochrome c5